MNKSKLMVTMELVKASEESPENEGYYTVFRIKDDGSIYSALHAQYTKHGWNTCYSNLTGEPYTDSRIFFEDDDDTWWVRTAVFPGVKFGNADEEVEE